MATVSTEVIDQSIENYRQQHDHMSKQLATLEKNYADNKALALKTLDMLSGAMQALDQLKENVEKDATPPVDPALTAPAAVEEPKAETPQG